MNRVAKILALICALATGAHTAAVAQMPERTPENVARYKAICRKHISADRKGMYREASGALQYPFIVPGSASYNSQLWDWDSWMCDIALRQVMLDCGSKADREELLEHEKGCILNFLNYGGADGWIPIWIQPDSPDRWSMIKDINPYKTNMHKPMLAQHAAFVVKQAGGDAEWLREQFHTLSAFVSKYLNYHRHKPTGLLYWENDFAIGVDNDPSTYYRPEESSGSILLNAFMYKELLAMEYLCQRLGMADTASRYASEAEALRDSIRSHCWDPRDGFYYSVDFNLLPVEKPATAGFNLHSGQPRTYDCLLQRFSVWSGFLAMWAGIATDDQARMMVERQYRNPDLFNAAAGVYTLSPLEKMFDTRPSGNPSSWLGPVWICANYFTFRGLVNYGFDDDARELAEKTILLLGRDFERHGALHEYYMPDNGEPVLNRGFQNWNLLVMNMAAWLDGKPTVTEF